MGQHHTIDLELNKKFTLEKLEWDSLYLERIDQVRAPRLGYTKSLALTICTIIFEPP